MIFASFVICELIALGCFVPWLWQWTGRSTAWLEGRKRGWPALFFLLCFALFQGLALSLLVFPDANDEYIIDSDALRFITTLLWIGVCPPLLLGLAFWWPQALLPDWIRERLNAGDPVKTARPIPSVRRQMTKRPNTRPASERPRRGGKRT